METLLVVDDEKNYLLVLKELLVEEGYEVLTAQSVQGALEILAETDPDLVLTDMKMPGMSGLELLERVKQKDPQMPVIMMTAFGTVEKAVEAMRKGAYDYITKPFDNEILKKTVATALTLWRVIKENRFLSEELQAKFGPSDLIGKSRAIQQVRELIQKVAATKATVLVTGESGTGKELVARALHAQSPRRDKPMISVNCSALAETLLESELFGHERGSFTGATSQRKGRFEIADGGTLFLDEVGEMAPAVQVTLLRVLQNREFERVGGNKTIKVDVRVIAASNRDLKEEVARGTFREDLYYRLNVVHVEVPPLRERREDLPLLIRYFLEKFAKELNKETPALSPEAMTALRDYPWPGNIRELENMLERAVILSSGSSIQVEDLPIQPKPVPGAEWSPDQVIPPGLKLNEVLEMVEKKMIVDALAKTGHVQSHAADLLGIEKNLFKYKMRKFGLT
ncbi:MAG: sigma-54 dependent transcriptional regulator [Desulfobacterota bacterium]|jgi:two-component system NtrC family response regulator|nr:sigma-54 dependent transcriptional regulator [Thermodesulfobacteriota bacterium]